MFVFILIIFYYTKQFILFYFIIFIIPNNHVIVVHTWVDVTPQSQQIWQFPYPYGLCNPLQIYGKKIYILWYMLYVMWCYVIRYDTIRYNICYMIWYDMWQKAEFMPNRVRFEIFMESKCYLCICLRWPGPYEVWHLKTFSVFIRGCLQWVRGLWNVIVKLIIYVAFVY